MKGASEKDLAKPEVEVSETEKSEFRQRSLELAPLTLEKLIVAYLALSNSSWNSDYDKRSMREPGVAISDTEENEKLSELVYQARFVNGMRFYKLQANPVLAALREGMRMIGEELHAEGGTMLMGDVLSHVAGEHPDEKDDIANLLSESWDGIGMESGDDFWVADHLYY
jgi:hypothetical protein